MQKIFEIEQGVPEICPWGQVSPGAKCRAVLLGLLLGLHRAELEVNTTLSRVSSGHCPLSNPGRGTHLSFPIPGFWTIYLLLT